MKVTRAQAEENRRKVVQAAGRLFREHGFDGVGLNEVMGAAGLTHGGFYKQFASKEDLVAEACERALADSVDKWAHVVAGAGDGALSALVRHYLSPSHRDRIGEGCALAGLGPDAVRHDPALRSRFEAGVRSHAGVLERAMQATPGSGHGADPSQDALAAFSTMLGALVLSRMVEDDALSRRILEAAATSLLARAGTRAKGRP